MGLSGHLLFPWLVLGKCPVYIHVISAISAYKCMYWETENVFPMVLAHYDVYTLCLINVASLNT